MDFVSSFDYIKNSIFFVKQSDYLKINKTNSAPQVTFYKNLYTNFGADNYIFNNFTASFQLASFMELLINDAKARFKKDLTPSEAACIADLLFCSSKLICDEEFLLKFKKKKIFTDLFGEKDKNVLTFTFLNSDKLYLTSIINFLNKTYYVYPFIDLNDRRFLSINSNLVIAYLNIIFDWSFELYSFSREINFK